MGSTRPWLFPLLLVVLAVSPLAWHVGSTRWGPAASPSPSLGKLYVAHAFGDDVAVMDIREGRTLKRIKTGRLPHNFALAADGRTLYVSEPGSQSLSAIDTQQDRVVRQRIVGEVPDTQGHRRMGMARVAAASSCKECHGARIVGSYPSGLTLSPEEKWLCVTELKTRQLSLIEPATLTTRRIVAIKNPVPTAPSRVVFEPLTGQALVFSREFDEKPVRNARRGDLASAADFAHDPPPGASYLTVYDKDLQVVRRRVRLPHAGPYGTVFSPDGQTVYVACRGADRVLAVDIATARVTQTFTVGKAPVALALSVDGRTLMAACYDEQPGAVYFIDRVTGRLVHRLQVAGNPAALVVHPRNGRVYVSAAGRNRIVEIDPVGPKVLREWPAGNAPIGLAIVE